MTEYQDCELHATPVYSILANAACALVLFRLVWEQASCGLICGVYLTTMGMARFTEEAWRGEPETPIVRGLRLYQWFAMASVVAGLILIAVPSPVFVASLGLWSPLTLAYAGVAGLIAMVALGVDFPTSTRRFSRLS